MKLKPEKKKKSGLNGIQNHDLCDTGAGMNLFLGFVCITATINHVFISFSAVQIISMIFQIMIFDIFV